jgi:hypothetical protein
MHRTDGTLLGTFVKERNEGAFEELLRRHGAMVMGVCRQTLGDPHDAEDAFQATFLPARSMDELVRAGLARRTEDGAAYTVSDAMSVVKTGIGERYVVPAGDRYAIVPLLGGLRAALEARDVCTSEEGRAWLGRAASENGEAALTVTYDLVALARLTEADREKAAGIDVGIARMRDALTLLDTRREAVAGAVWTETAGGQGAVFVFNSREPAAFARMRDEHAELVAEDAGRAGGLGKGLKAATSFPPAPGEGAAQASVGLDLMMLAMGSPLMHSALERAMAPALSLQGFCPGAAAPVARAAQVRICA